MDSSGSDGEARGSDPVCIPGSDDEVSGVSGSFSKCSFGTPVLHVSNSKAIKQRALFTSSDKEKENNHPSGSKTSNKATALDENVEKGRPALKEDIIYKSSGAADMRKVIPPKDELEYANVTSTPLFPNRRFKQLDDLDLTAIGEDEDELGSPKVKSGGNPFKKAQPNRRRVQQILSSSSSSEDEAEAPKDDEKKKSATNENEVFDISSLMSSIKLDTRKEKKEFKFKAQNKIEETVDVSNESETVTLKSSEEDLRVSSTDDEESEDESLETHKETKKIPKGTGAGLPEREPKIKFIDLPVAGPAIPTGLANEFTFGVQSTISKLAKIIQSTPAENILAPDPPGLRVNLYDHQRYGLEWLSWREQQFPGGGILADEMGLGKTIMIIALVLRSKDERNAKKGTPAPPRSWISTDTRNLVPSHSTLVVVPASVMGQWENEINKKARNLKVYLYHGPKRTSSAAVLAQYDFILTTYQTLGSDVPKEEEDMRHNSRSPLMRVQWERVVLDEGHTIRNSKTLGAQGVSRLNALHRWVVTGTPVHNKPSDLQSLMKFLHLTPFDDPKVWNFWIGLKSVSASNTERLNIIGKALILRRTKEDVKATGGNVASIPPKTVVDVKIQLTPEEKQIYDHLHEFAAQQFKMFLKNKEDATAELQNAANKYVAGGARKPSSNTGPTVNISHIFVLILRLRQASVLPHLITTMLEEDPSDKDISATEFDPMNEGDIISRKNPVFAESYVSSKLIRLMADLDEVRNVASAEQRPMDKVVIVSQWTSLLRLVDRNLRHRGFSTTTISGEVKIADRMDLMARFNSKKNNPQIMLLSLAAGGVGLNLVGANRLFFLDIHWNPQLELQAQDRIHRFGQTKDVTITRYISEGTMEERVMDLQSKKLELANGLLSNSKKKVGTGLSIPEIRQLFDC